MNGRKGIRRVDSLDIADSDRSNPEEIGITLDELGSAYEQAMQEAINSDGHSPLVEHPTEPDKFSDDIRVSSQQVENEVLLAAPAAVDADTVAVTPESILEAMLFVGSSNSQPLTAQRFVEIVRGVTPADVESMVDSLNNSYAKQQRAMEIVRVSGGYRMQLCLSLNRVQDRFYGKARETVLTQSAVDCLSLVAYQPGITREEIEKQWSQPASNILNMLIRRGLLRVDLAAAQPTQKSAKRHQRYFTTDRFLEVIGLKSISDLPQAEDL